MTVVKEERNEKTNRCRKITKTKRSSKPKSPKPPKQPKQKISRKRKDNFIDDEDEGLDENGQKQLDALNAIFRQGVQNYRGIKEPIKINITNCLSMFDDLALENELKARKLKKNGVPAPIPNLQHQFDANGNKIKRRVAPVLI